MGKRILFINHPESDYGGAMLYTGLCRTFGAENVFDCPRKVSYHGQCHNYDIPKIQNGSTGPYPWFETTPDPWTSKNLEPVPQITLSDKAIQEAKQMLDANEFDLVVVESMRDVCRTVYEQLKPSIARAAIRIVLHDGEDFSILREQIINEINPHLLLKREYPLAWPDHMNVGGTEVIPYPFSNAVSAIATRMPSVCETIVEREYDAVMMCGNTFPTRQALIDKLRKHEDGMKVYLALNPDYDKTGLRSTSPLEGWLVYMAIFGGSKLGISERGFGWDTVRYWEVPMMTVLMSCKLDIRIPNPFKNMETCVEYDAAHEVPGIIKRLTREADCATLTQIYNAGKEHLLRYHTAEARVAYMLERLGFNVG